MRVLLLIVLLLSSLLSKAEIYRDFTPGLSVAQVKKNYPNASIVRVKAAWLKQNQEFLKLTGDGIVGIIYLAFSYNDEYILRRKEELEKKIAENPTLDNSSLNEMLVRYQNRIDSPIEEKMTLDWVRWIPPEKLPYDRIKSRYGEPDKCDYTVDEFIPYCNWESKAVNVNLSDDKKFVNSIEYSFTTDEVLSAYGFPTQKTEQKTPSKEGRVKKRAVN